MATVLAIGELNLEKKHCVTITVEEARIWRANGVGETEWGFQFGPVKGPKNDKSNSFAPVVLILHHAFKNAIKPNTLVTNSFLSKDTLIIITNCKIQ